MGHKWTVWAWVADNNVRGGYVWMDVWGGSSAVKAVWAAMRAKRSGAGCVKVEWR